MKKFLPENCHRFYSVQVFEKQSKGNFIFKSFYFLFQLPFFMVNYFYTIFKK